MLRYNVSGYQANYLWVQSTYKMVVSVFFASCSEALENVSKSQQQTQK